MLHPFYLSRGASRRLRRVSGSKNPLFDFPPFPHPPRLEQEAPYAPFAAVPLSSVTSSSLPTPTLLINPFVFFFELDIVANRTVFLFFFCCFSPL